MSAGLVACLGFSAPENDIEEDVALPGRSTPRPDGAVPEQAQVTQPEAPDAAPMEASMVDVVKKPLRAFVSSSIQTGNLGGVAAADKLCNSLATAAGIGGNYRAWLSVSGSDAIDRITSTGPWHLVSGEVVAADKAGLTNGQLAHLLDKDEKGATPPDVEDRVWTGTGPNGRYAAPDCSQWNAQSGSGLVGEANNTNRDKWTALVGEACSEVNRIYCLEL